MTQPQPFASIRYFFNALGPGFAPALSGLSRLVTDGTGTIWAQWRLVPTFAFSSATKFCTRINSYPASRPGTVSGRVGDPRLVEAVGDSR